MENTAVKETADKLDFVKKNYVVWKKHWEIKGKRQTETVYLLYTYMTNAWFSEYVNSYNPVTRRQMICLKIGQETLAALSKN